MSRLPRQYVWLNYFDGVRSALCPCCLEKRISTKAKNWERGHVIPARRLGPDTYVNIRPICVSCNSRDKAFDTNYHYMISIGTMIEEDLEPALARIELMFRRQQKNPHEFQCTAYLKSKPTKTKTAARTTTTRTTKHVRCKHARIPRSMYCGVHPYDILRAPTKMEAICMKLIKSLNEALRMEEGFWEEYELENFRETRADLIENMRAEAEKNNGRTGVLPFK